MARLTAEAFPHPHTLLAAVCMAHLTECGFPHSTINSEDELDETLRFTPFLRYTYDSWSVHARESLSDRPAALRCAEFVQTCHSFPVKTHSSVFGLFDSLGPLHVVAFFDLPIELAGPTCLQSPNSITAREGRTALHFACLRHSVIAAEELLRVPGLLVNARDKRDITPLAWSIRYSWQESEVSLLLGHPEIDVNARGLWGYVPLHWAADYHNEVAMKALLSHPRIDVNVVEMLEGTGTPLTMASQKGYEGMVQLLLAHPAIRVTSREIEAARNSGLNAGVRERIVALLQEFMDQKAADLDE